jgi:hypothetical protein
MGKSLFLYREFKYLKDELASRGSRSLMVITDRPVMYVAMGYGAISYETFSRQQKRFLHSLNRHLYDIYVVQQVSEKSSPMPQLDSDKYTVQIIRQWQTQANITLRLVQLHPIPLSD